MTLKDDLRHEKNMSATWEKLAHANKDRAIEMEQRAEAAEAERDEARLELQHIRTMLDDGSDCDDTALDMVKRMHAQCYELRRQLSEAQHAIDVLSNTVVAQDATIKQLEQARSDIEDYRFRVNELFKACKAARDWFARNTNQDHTPGPVEKMLIDATQVEATA